MAWLLAAALALVAFADPDEQPACLARCEDAYEATLQECQSPSEPDRVDECRDTARDRHQDCVDDCMD